MGAVAAVLAFTKQVIAGVYSAVVKVDLGGGRIITPQHFSAPGDDAQPLADDFAALVETKGAGSQSVVGYHDPRNEPKAGPGEKRGYARDPTTGEPVAEIWAKNTGEIVLEVLKDSGAPIRIATRGPVIVESPDIRLGDSPGRRVAREGDLVQVVFRGLSAAPGSPVVPVPPAAPTPTGGIVCIGQIITGADSCKAGP